jgi:SAM-dependent methyltransferase
MAASDPTRRFTIRVEDYERYRPDYPREVLAALQREHGLLPSHVIADVGSGTGLSAQLFVANGNEVYGVEPNEAMAAAAARRFPGARFHDVRGQAEATALPDRSIDFIVAGQAFHWFKPAETAVEFRRVLKPHGQLAVVWNRRRLDSTAFLRAYEDLLQRFGTDYRQVSERYAEPTALATVFGGEGFRRHRFDHHQLFDRAGLRGRTLSSSYTPPPGHPDHEPMLAALDAIFDAHADAAGRVSFDYDTELFVGPLRQATRDVASS